MPRGCATAPRTVRPPSLSRPWAWFQGQGNPVGSPGDKKGSSSARVHKPWCTQVRVAYGPVRGEGARAHPNRVRVMMLRREGRCTAASLRRPVPFQARVSSTCAPFDLPPSDLLPQSIHPHSVPRPAPPYWYPRLTIREAHRSGSTACPTAVEQQTQVRGDW